MEGLTGPKANPTVSQRSNVRRFVTSAAGAPSVEARAQGATAGLVEVRGPAEGAWDGYELTVCALRTGSCNKVPCPKAAQDPTVCSLIGLDDDSLYSVQVCALVLLPALQRCSGRGDPMPHACHASLRTLAGTSATCRTVHAVCRWWLCGTAALLCGALPRQLQH